MTPTDLEIEVGEALAEECTKMGRLILSDETKWWHARIKVDGVNRHIGYFDRRIDAAAAYNEAARKAFGEYAYENKLIVV